MSRGRGKDRRALKPEPVSALAVPKPRSRFVGTLGAFGLGVAVAAAVFLSLPSGAGPMPAKVVQPPPPDPQLWHVLSMTDDELKGIDIGYLNLLCATGLPGAESLNVEDCRQQLDVWAKAVQFDTGRHLYKFRENPDEYDGKEGVYRMMMLLTVLQQDLGVHYNMERVRNVDFKRSQDLFIHGMIGNANGGTCVSMPVLYTAIARRLGYPVTLALAKAHVFCRWNDGKNSFNIEGSGVGFSSHPDEYYRKWPHPIADVEVQKGDYLRSLTPREELAVFLAARGHCLEDNGRALEAVVAYAHSNELSGGRRENLTFLVETVGKHAGLIRGPRQQQRGGVDKAAIQADYEERRRENQLARQRQDQELQRVIQMNRQNQGFGPQLGVSEQFGVSDPDNFATFNPPVP